MAARAKSAHKQTSMASGTLKIGIVMDPIESIVPYKDSSLAMLLEAERRNAEIHYYQQHDMRLLAGKAIGRGHRLLMLETLLDHIQSHPGVRFSTMADYVASWRAANPLSAVLPTR